MADATRAAWWGNLLGYQACWFVAVVAAGRGAWWPGPLAAAAFAAWQLAAATPEARRRAVRVAGCALLAGAIIDGLLARAGALHFAAATPAVPPGGAPAWILGLWLAFAMTLPVSLAFLQRRMALASVLGAVGAPLAYLGAARGWNAVAFAVPAWPVLVALCCAWAIALPLLAAIAGKRA
ncbi:MAG: DUF2878 domain-containing protein [Luteimonas sp.]